MKTAMQQMIDFLEPELEMGDFLQLPAYEKAKELLEAEKEQIMEAWRQGEDHGHNYYEGDYIVENKDEEYYQQTYNPEQ